ncbi:hypothetical protein [Trichothermofontia sp.]
MTAFTIAPLSQRLFPTSLAVGLLLCPGAALAQMSLSPLVLQTTARRGEAQGVLNVTNVTDQVFRARVYAEPFTYTDSGFQTLQPGEAMGDLTPYLQFSPTELVVPPGATRRIRLISHFPPNLAEGEYRAVIFTEALQGDNLTEVATDNTTYTVSIKARIGATFYVYQGDLSPALSVEGASWNAERQAMQLLVKNGGGASERPRINWTLKQGGTTIATGTVPESGVIAQTQRQILLPYPAPDQAPPKAGEYQLLGELVWIAADRTRTVPFNVNLTLPVIPRSAAPP